MPLSPEVAARLAVIRAGRTSLPGGTTQAGRLLRSRLNAIQRYGTPEAAARANRVARTGDSGDFSPFGAGLKALEGIGFVAGLPLRTIAATAEAGLEGLTGKQVGKDWWQNVTDSSYGSGRVIEGFLPKGNIWAKRVAGFGFDVLLDPLTYLTAGASPALKAAGKSKGLVQIAGDAARAVELGDQEIARLGLSAADWANLGAKAGKGGARLSNEELGLLARASGRTPEAFRYGVGFNIPFTRTEAMVPGRASEAVGRGMQRTGQAIARTVGKSKVGTALGGRYGELRAMMRSGDPEQALTGARLWEAVRRGKGTEGYLERELLRPLRAPLKQAEKLGIDDGRLFQALGERPIMFEGAMTAPGPNYTALIQSMPEAEPVVKALGDYLDQVPAKAHDAARFGDQEWQFIADAAEGGRPYVPRVLSEEFRQQFTKRGGQFADTAAERAWFERGARTVGDEVIPGDPTTELVRPGTPWKNGEAAPALETQVEQHLADKIGPENAVNWYETSVKKALPDYARAVARQGGNYHAFNVLRSQGMADRWAEWLPTNLGGEPGVRVQAVFKDVQRQLDDLDTKIAGHLDGLQQLDQRKAQLAAKRLAGEITKEQFDAETKRLAADTLQSLDQVRRAQDDVLRLTGEENAQRIAKRGAMRRARKADQAFTAAKTKADDLTARVQELAAQAGETPETLLQKPERTWEEFRSLVAERDKALADAQALETAPERVNMLYQEAVNAQSVAQELRLAAEIGTPVEPDWPFYNVANDLAVRKFGTTIDNLDLNVVADALEGQSERQLHELAKYGERFPADVNPRSIAAQKGVWAKRVEATNAALVDAYQAGATGAELDGVKQAYEEAVQAYNLRASISTMQRDWGAVPTVEDLVVRQEEIGKQAVQAQAALAGSTPGQRAAAALDTEMRAYEGRLNQAGYTMKPQAPGGVDLGQEVGPGLFQGPDGTTRRVTPMADQTHAVSAVTADNVYRVLGFKQPTTYVGQGPQGLVHAANVPENVLGTVGDLLAAGDQQTMQAMADAYSRQALTDVFLGTYNWAPTDMAFTQDGRLVRTTAANAIPPTSDDVALAIDKVFFGGSSSGFLRKPTGVSAWDDLLKASNLSPGEMSSRMAQSWQELVAQGVLHSSVDGQIDWGVLAAKTMGAETPEARAVGDALNARFEAMRTFMDNEMFADTEGLIDAVRTDGPKDALDALLMPETRVWSPVAKYDEAVFGNPLNDQNTWFHAGSGPLAVTGPFDLAHRTEMVGTTGWLDYGWGPALAADPNLSGNWAPYVSEVAVHAPPNRVLRYGDTSTIREFAIDPRAQAAERAGVGHPGGVGYEMFTADVMRRAISARPQAFEQAIESLAKSSVDRHQTAAEVFRLATTIVDAYPGNMGWDDAVEIAARHLRGAWGDRVAGTVANFDFHVLDNLRAALDPNGYRPYAADLAVTLWSDRAVPRELREQLLDGARQSLAREGDVIVMHNEHFANLPDAISQANTLVAFPTSQVAFSVTNGQGAAATVARERAAYEAGRQVPNPARARAEERLARVAADLPDANATVRAAESTLRMTQSDLAQVQADLAAVQAKRAEAVMAGDKAAADYAARKQELLTRAVDAQKMRDSLMRRDDQLSAQVAHLEAKANELQATYDADVASRALAQARHDQIAPLMAQTLKDGWVGFGFGKQAPADVVKVLTDLNRKVDLNTGEGLTKFLREYDKVNNWMKGWLTASVGFQIRNVFGGMFNNWLADADVVRSTVGWGKTMAKAWRNPEAMTTAERIQFEVINRLGIIRSGVFHDEFVTGLEHMSLNPLAGIRNPDKAFIAPYATRKIGENLTEPLLRGSLAYDRINKAVREGRVVLDGKRITDLSEVAAEDVPRVVDSILTSRVGAEITDDVATYHFDYTDLSTAEKAGIKRIIPFYTWTKNNVPLQLEAMFSQPGKALQRYAAVKRNLELGTPEEQIVPSYFGEQQMIRLPFASGSGDRWYGTVDLPFKDVTRILDPGQTLGMVSPLLKSPFEVWAGKQFYTDVPVSRRLQPLPGSWAKIPGLVPVLQAAGKVQKGPDGQPYMREKDAYLIQQYLPFMAQMRRLLPGEEKYQRRAATTWMSWLGGVQARTNTPQDQENEVFRRTDELTNVVNDLRSLGVIPRAG